MEVGGTGSDSQAAISSLMYCGGSALKHSGFASFVNPSCAILGLVGHSPRCVCDWCARRPGLEELRVIDTALHFWYSHSDRHTCEHGARLKIKKDGKLELQKLPAVLLHFRRERYWLLPRTANCGSKKALKTL